MPTPDATNEQILASKAALSRTHAFPASDWPPDNPAALAKPGLYAWYLDRAGAVELTTGYGLPVRAALAYIGEAGVRTKADLRQRVECHLWKCRVGRSTIRRTLACGLLRDHGWTVISRRRLAPDCDKELTAWMAEHLRVAVHSFKNRIVLEDLERQVIAQLRPQLNIPRSKSMRTPLQSRISELRLRYDLQ